MQHIGFLVVSNTGFNNFRYPLMRTATDHVIKTPGMGTVSISLSFAKKQGAKLMLDQALDAETRAKVQRVWGKR